MNAGNDGLSPLWIGLMIAVVLGAVVTITVRNRFRKQSAPIPCATCGHDLLASHIQYSFRTDVIDPYVYTIEACREVNCTCERGRQSGCACGHHSTRHMLGKAGLRSGRCLTPHCPCRRFTDNDADHCAHCGEPLLVVGGPCATCSPSRQCADCHHDLLACHSTGDFDSIYECLVSDCSCEAGVQGEWCECGHHALYHESGILKGLCRGWDCLCREFSNNPEDTRVFTSSPWCNCGHYTWSHVESFDSFPFRYITCRENRCRCREFLSSQDAPQSAPEWRWCRCGHSWKSHERLGYQGFPGGCEERRCRCKSFSNNALDDRPEDVYSPDSNRGRFWL